MKLAGGILEKSGIANVPKAVLGALGSPALGLGQVLTGGALVPEAAAMGAAEPRDDQFVLVRLGGGPIADSLANLNIQHPGLGIQIVNAGDLVQVGVTPEGTDVNVDTDSEVTVETIDDSDSLVFREPLFQEARRP